MGVPLTSSGPEAGSTIERATVLVDLALAAAKAYGRDDFAERLTTARERLCSTSVTVLVVGEFKQGKSSLVNALLDAAACPVDDDIATSTPTVLRWAEQPEAFVTRVVDEPAEEGQPEEAREPIAVEDIALWASETGNPGNGKRVRVVEIGIPHPLLAPGLVIVDTPGVGGLGSRHGAVTAAALPMADALLFVSDASQELSAPELEFLSEAHTVCPNVVMLLTKVDLYARWQEIGEIDRQRLEAAALPVGVVPVSSTLHLWALRSGDAALDAESGFPTLERFLRDEVVDGSHELSVRGAVHHVLTMTAQLEQTFRGEHEALCDPERAAELVRDLETARTRTDALRSQASRWVHTLNDGFADLNADLDHDLRRVVRDIQREADETIDTHDPAAMWDEFEPWLYRRVGADMAHRYLQVAGDIEDLAVLVAQHFAEAEGGEMVGIELGDPRAVLDALEGTAAVELAAPPSAMTRGLTALRGAYSGSLMFSSLGSMAGLALVSPVTMGIGILMGRKALRDERERALAQRRQQAKQSVRRYLDEVQFAVGKDARRALRLAQRSLRDGFAARAEELQRTCAEAVAHAQRAAQGNEQDRARRARDIEAELQRIAALNARAAALLPEPAGGLA